MAESPTYAQAARYLSAMHPKTKTIFAYVSLRLRMMFPSLVSAGVFSRLLKIRVLVLHRGLVIL